MPRSFKCSLAYTDKAIALTDGFLTHNSWKSSPNFQSYLVVYPFGNLLHWSNRLICSNFPCYNDDAPPQERAMAEHFKRTIQNPERNVIKFIATVTMKAVHLGQFCTHKFLKNVGVSRTTMYESSQTSRRILKEENQSSLVVCKYVWEGAWTKRSFEAEYCLKRRGQPPEILCPWPPRVLKDSSEFISHFSVMVWWNETICYAMLEGPQRYTADRWIKYKVNQF